MAAPLYTTLNETTSLFSIYTSTGSFYYKNLNLPVLNESLIGRVIYCKEASEYPGVPFYIVSSSSGNLIETSTTVGISRHQSITLQATQSSTTSYWSILNGYRGNIEFSTQQLPLLSLPIYPSTVSQLFVDLRTNSKTVVLPKIQTLSQLSSSAMFMTIKDAYGWASTSTLYVSSTYPDTIDMSTINNSIQITCNYASIDLVANPVILKWNILSYYNGSLVQRP